MTTRRLPIKSPPAFQMWRNCGSFWRSFVWEHKRQTDIQAEFFISTLFANFSARIANWMRCFFSHHTCYNLIYRRLKRVINLRGPHNTAFFILAHFAPQPAPGAVVGSAPPQGRLCEASATCNCWRGIGAAVVNLDQQFNILTPRYNPKRLRLTLVRPHLFT
jgi:hypothetical protein